MIPKRVCCSQYLFRRYHSHCRRQFSSSSSSPPFILRNPLQWYTNKLDTHPLTTKCITSGLIAGSGDVLCQYLNRKRSDDVKRDTYQKSFDWTRTIRFTILGSFLVAPTVHTWYGYLMSSIPGSSISAIVKRLFLDQGVFAPIFLPTFISCLTVLEHINVFGEKNDDKVQKNESNDTDLLSHITNRLRSDVPEALVVGWSIWIPSMAIMFAFVPSKFQVLYSNCVGFVWNAYLSYCTHEGEENIKENGTNNNK